MEKFKFSVLSIIILGLIIFIGYWAFSTIESGSEHVYKAEIEKLKQENQELRENLDSLPVKNEEQNLEESIIKEEEIPVVSEKNILKHQSLIDELQKLIDDNVILKKGSKGTRVGTVQKFLNVYNNTSNKIDNDYGKKTITLIKEFEEKEKLIISEEIGKNTFQVMIDWLKEQ